MTNQVSAVARVNFYNSHDYALSMPIWGFNQLLKPDASGDTEYSYTSLSNGRPIPRIFGGSVPTPPSFFIPSPARNGTPQLTGIRQMGGYFKATDPLARFLNFEFDLDDMYEAMSFAAESRTYPVGSLNDPAMLDEQVNLQDFWPPDPEPDPDLGNFGRHKWHSGQFRSNAARNNGYWSLLLSDRGFNIQ